MPSKKPRTPPRPANDRITTDTRESHTNTRLTFFLPPRGNPGVSLKWRSVAYLIRDAPPAAEHPLGVQGWRMAGGSRELIDLPA